MLVKHSIKNTFNKFWLDILIILKLVLFFGKNTKRPTDDNKAFSGVYIDIKIIYWYYDMYKKLLNK